MGEGPIREEFWKVHETLVNCDNRLYLQTFHEFHEFRKFFWRARAATATKSETVPGNADGIGIAGVSRR